MYVEVQNRCQADICLEPTGQPQPRPFVLPARSTILLKVPVTDALKPIALKYTAKNFLIALGEGLPVALEIPTE